MSPSKLVLSFSLSITFLCLTTVESTLCINTTCLALGSYYVWSGATLTLISTLSNYNSNNNILSYNPQITDENSIQVGSRINIPFSCGCIDYQFLGHVFLYTIQNADSYGKVADTYYASLTTTAMLEKYNSYDATDVAFEARKLLNVTVQCSCGDTSVSNVSAVFITYPLRKGDSLKSIATDWNVSTALLQSYNRGVDFSSGSGLVYIPDYNASSLYSPTSSDNIAPSYQAKEPSSDYNASSLSPTPRAPTTTSSPGTLSGGLIAGISLGAVMGVLLVAVCIYCVFYRQKGKRVKINVSRTHDDLPFAGQGSKSDAIGTPGSASPLRSDISVDKSVNKYVKFSNEELAKATNNFSDDLEIGKGGYGAVYRATLLEKEVAIKKMDMTARKEFQAELDILTVINHVNVVRLAGYCEEGYLFIVYEYVDNGNLDEHLYGTGENPLPWSTRVQIALHSARGLEYIHQLAEPGCIHRDIKPANILIDKKFNAKIADFGLTKLLAEDGGSSQPTRLLGTSGYSAPEYTKNGSVSQQGDIYAFGVVLYALISAKESTELVAWFAEVLDESDPTEGLRRLVDQRIKNYPIDSVHKMAKLAKQCTLKSAKRRPRAGDVVRALTTLSPMTENWDSASFYEDPTLANLMSGR